MNYSGILVVATRDRFEPLQEALNALDGVEVFHSDENSSRLVVAQEAASIDDEVAGLKRIKALPGVVLAEMITHYFGDSGSEPADDAGPEGIDVQSGFDSRVIAYLNNA
ncbi:MAG: chaperone NapD [Gammaproteobacteria bacterium]|jgi:periplasmic nitrate reductase NapD